MRKAALAPIQMKIWAFERLLAAIARRSQSGASLMETNGGIANGLRLMMPSSKHSLLFGHPGNHKAERATLALAQALARHSAAFLDVGANEGLFAFTIATASAADAPGIHCFEPDPELFARLDENLRRNSINACAINTAVGARNGTATFYRNLSDDASGSLTSYFANKHETIPIEVPVLALGDYLVRSGLQRACVKVDVEGAGLGVWEGIGKAFDRIDWLIMEMLEPEINAGLPRRIMADAGWHAYYIRDFNLVHSIDGEFDYQAPFYNWLLCGTRPELLGELLAKTPFHVIGAKR
jgi:FkbM family methyltransferase